MHSVREDAKLWLRDLSKVMSYRQGWLHITCSRNVTRVEEDVNRGPQVSAPAGVD